MRKLVATFFVLLICCTLFAIDSDISVSLGSIKRLSSTSYCYSKASISGDIKSISITVDNGSFSVADVNADISDYVNRSKTYFVNSASEAQTILRKAEFTQDTSTSIASQKVTITISSGVTDFSQLPSGISTKLSQALIDNTMHYYAFVDYSQISFSDAYAKAKQMKFNGLKGYLATITSSDEDKLLDNITSSAGWAGGALVSEENAKSNGDTFKDKNGTVFTSAAKTDGSNPYRWVCGPEAGTAFNYTNWNSGEPTGLKIQDNEYCVQIHYSTGKKWNDLFSTSKLNGFFVEWSEDTRTSGSGKTVYSVSGINKSDLLLSYVKDTGSDSDGDGSLINPFKTINKAYAANEGFGTIALLSDITVTSKLSIEEGKKIVITSANSDGSLVDNEPNDYENVRTIHRGTYTDNLIEMIYTSSLTLKQIILDGDKKEVSTYLIMATSNNGDVTINLDTNCVLKNNISTGNNGSNCGSGIVLGAEHSSYNPKMYMTSNSKITGCIAPRHGGALTIYDGDVYMQDDSLMEYNGVEYKSSYSAYYGGGAILCYRGNLHMSGNSKITKNFVQLNGGFDSYRKHNAMQADPNTESKVYISDNAKIFDNYDDGKLTFNDDGTYTLKGNVRANAYANGEAFYIEGEMGPNAKIGVTISGAYNGMTVVQANTGYTLSTSDTDAFFEDSSTYKFYKDGNVIKLSTDLEPVKLVLDSLNSTTLKGTFEVDIQATTNDITVFKNGEKIESGYILTVVGKTLTATFEEDLPFNTKIGVAVAKNGYKVNDGKMVEINYGHNHKWYFTAVGSAFRAICMNDDGYEQYCDNHYNDDSDEPIYIFFTSNDCGNLGGYALPLNATDPKLSWTSSDPSSVKVDNNGRITILKATTTPVIITSSTVDGSHITNSCTVSVN